MRNQEHINKTVRIPKVINELVGEISSSNAISINRYIICSCILSYRLIMSGLLNIEYFIRQGEEYGEDDWFSHVRRVK